MKTFEEIYFNHASTDMMDWKDRCKAMMKEASEQAIDRCAESAKCLPDEHAPFMLEVDKQSILNVKYELK